MPESGSGNMAKCPNCTSLNTSYNYAKERAPTPLGFTKEILIKVYTCLDCHHTWREQV